MATLPPRLAQTIKPRWAGFPLPPAQGMGPCSLSALGTLHMLSVGQWDLGWDSRTSTGGFPGSCRQGAMFQEGLVPTCVSMQGKELFYELLLTTSREAQEVAQ